MKLSRQFRALLFLVCALGASMLLAAYSRARNFPLWAFPASNMHTQSATNSAAAMLIVRLPGASRAFSEDALHDLYAAPDWFPDKHPPAPAIVLSGRKGVVAACGYCHLPDGSGRPENASLSGLPADYIRRQVAAFRSGKRTSAAQDYVPSKLMAQVAANATDQEIEAAAKYFSAISAQKHVHVVETERVSGSEAKAYLLRQVPGLGERLGDRIVEGPSDFERFERRDPRLAYVAYVPTGSLKLGALLARTGGDGVTMACYACHGAGLRGGAGAVGPPLAGRSPSYIFRQLYGFSTGARGGPASLPMQTVVAHLTQKDMIALAAYVGNQRP